MARPTVISDQQILQAARALFLERGVRATSSEVARRAGVAEGTVFRRFPTKQQLFLAAMRPDIDPSWMIGLAERAGTGDLRRTLVEIGLQAIEFMRRLLPIVMMTWSSSPQLPGALPEALAGAHPTPLVALDQMTRLFAGELRLRRIAKHDPQVLARMFLGSIQNYVFFEVIFGDRQPQALPPEEFLHGLAKALWLGLDRRPGPWSPASPPARRRSPARGRSAPPRPRTGRRAAPASRRAPRHPEE